MFIILFFYLIKYSLGALFDATYILPPSDIPVQSGESFNITVYLNNTVLKNKGCKVENIKFYKGKSKINTLIINDLTAFLQIKKVTKKDSGFYQIICDLDEKIFLGVRHITVMDPPSPVYDFKCVAHNWIEMECRWKFNNTLDEHTLYYGVFQFPNITDDGGQEDLNVNDPSSNYRIFNNKVGKYRDYVDQDQQPTGEYTINRTYEGSFKFVNKVFNNKDEEIRFFPDWKYYFIMRSSNEIGKIYQNFTIDPKEIIKPDPPTVVLNVVPQGLNLHLLSSILPYPDALSLTFSINVTFYHLRDAWKYWEFQITRTPTTNNNASSTMPHLEEPLPPIISAYDDHYSLRQVYYSLPIFSTTNSPFSSETVDKTAVKQLFKPLFQREPQSPSVSSASSNILNVTESSGWIQLLSNVTYGYGSFGTLNVHPNASVEITDLIPFVDYEVRVRAKPRYKGYYSDAKVILDQTLPDVPRVKPITSPNGFEISRNYLDTFNKITIYWKSIPESLYFGPHFHYNIYDERNLVATNITNNFYSLQLALDDAANHTFTITAENSLGEGWHSDPVLLRQNNFTNAKPQNVRIVHSQTQEYTLIWNSHGDLNGTDFNHFTIYTCKIHQYIPFTCGPNIDWIRFDRNDAKVIRYNPDIYQFNPNLSHRSRILGYGLALDTNFLVGIAFQQTSLNSQGIVWSACVVKHDLDPKSPKFNSRFVTQTSRSIRVEWVKDTCQSEGSPISFYELETTSTTKTEHGKSENMNLEMNKNKLIPYSKYPIIELEDLKPYTTYNLRLRSISITNRTSRFSAPLVIQTLEEAPEDSCWDIQIKYAYPDILFTWKDPTIPNGNITYYLVNVTAAMSSNKLANTRKRELGINSSKPSKPNSTLISWNPDYKVQSYRLNKNFFTFLREDWFGNSDYVFQLKACNEVGCSPLSNDTYYFKTPIKEPSEITVTEYKPLNQSHVLLLWKPPQHFNGPLSHYDISVTEHLKKEDSATKIVKVKHPGTYYASLKGHIIQLKCYERKGNYFLLSNESIFPYYNISLRAVTTDSKSLYPAPFARPKIISIPCSEESALNANRYKWNIATSVISLMILSCLLAVFVYFLKRKNGFCDKFKLIPVLPWTEEDLQNYLLNYQPREQDFMKNYITNLTNINQYLDEKS